MRTCWTIDEAPSKIAGLNRLLTPWTGLQYFLFAPFVNLQPLLIWIPWGMSTMFIPIPFLSLLLSSLLFLYHLLCILSFSLTTSFIVSSWTKEEDEPCTYRSTASLIFNLAFILAAGWKMKPTSLRASFKPKVTVADLQKFKLVLVFVYYSNHWDTWYPILEPNQTGQLKVLIYVMCWVTIWLD